MRLLILPPGNILDVRTIVLLTLLRKTRLSGAGYTLTSIGHRLHAGRALSLKNAHEGCKLSYIAQLLRRMMSQSANLGNAEIRDFHCLVL